MGNDLKNLIKNCSICTMKSNTLLKKEPSLQIISNYPKQRYVGDLTDIPYQFRVNNDYKFIFTIVDHFRKWLTAFY